MEDVREPLLMLKAGVVAIEPSRRRFVEIIVSCGGDGEEMSG